MNTSDYYHHGEVRTITFRQWIKFQILVLHQTFFGSPAGLWRDTAKKVVRDYIHGGCSFHKCCQGGHRLRGWD